MTDESTDFIPQMEPWFDEAEAEAVYEYMKSGGWVTEFRKTRELEAMIAEYVGAKHCTMTPNGTLSLTLALYACGVGPGDEVIVPDYTMLASATSVRLTGAEVVFADIDINTLCLDFNAMKAAMTERTKAVMLVSINGRFPANIEEYVDFCRTHDIALIEDAAQSLGSRKDGKHLGTFGVIGSFSFSAPKVISTGQGGALVTDDDEMIDRLRKLRDFGREGGGSDHYLTMGWNLKFTDLQAVVGIEQIKKLPWRVERKKEIFSRYRDSLGDVAGLSFIPTNLDDTSPWFIDVLVRRGSRDELMEALKAAGVGARPFYPALHAEPVYARDEHHPIAERVAGEGLWLPSCSKLTNEQVDRVCDAVVSAL